MKRMIDVLATVLCRKGYVEKKGVIECRYGDKKITLYEDKTSICFCGVCMPKKLFVDDLEDLVHLALEKCIYGE